MPPPAVQSPFHGLDRDTKDFKSPKRVESMEKSSAATHVGPVGDEFVGLLGRTDKNGSESQQVFNEVLDQLTAQEDELGMQPSLYTLPSMTFLESLLDEMDSRNASNGMLSEPPMYLPEGSLELPGLELAGAGSTLEDLGLHSPSMLLQKPAYSCPAGAMHRGPSGFSSQGSMGGMGMIPNASVNMPNPFAPAPTAGSAAPSPVKRPPSKQTDDEDDDVLHELNYSYETSKSGRCRKVSSFLVSGNKRKLNMISQHSAPAVVAGGSGRQASGATAVDINPFGPEHTEVASTYKKKGQKGRSRSKTTVCLNCGSMDTPQWRVGPLGPRTLCNACGVRFKKGLPLSCYPLRNGMVLPPGATLPPSVVVPPGMNIIIQPLKPTTGVSGSLAADGSLGADGSVGAKPYPLFAGGLPADAQAPPSPAVLISDK